VLRGWMDGWMTGGKVGGERESVCFGGLGCGGWEEEEEGVMVVP